MLPPPSPIPKILEKKKINKNKNKIKANKVTRTRKQTKKNKQIHKQTNKNKSSTVAPEPVTLDCSLTHVLQEPNTQPYHS